MNPQVKIIHFESTRHQLCIWQQGNGKMALVDTSTGAKEAVISQDLGNRLVLLALERETSRGHE